MAVRSRKMTVTVRSRKMTVTVRSRTMTVGSRTMTVGSRTAELPATYEAAPLNLMIQWLPCWSALALAGPDPPLRYTRMLLGHKAVKNQAD